MGFCRLRATTLLICAAFLSGCLSPEERPLVAPIAASAPVEVRPGLTIEAWRHPAAGISDFSSDRLVRQIAERLRRNRSEPVAEDLLIRIIFVDYQEFDTGFDYDDIFGNRLRIEGALELIDPADGTVLTSNRLVRSLRLKTYHDPWQFDSRLRGRYRPWPGRIPRLIASPSQMRILERAFASAAASWILAASNDLPPDSEKATQNQKHRKAIPPPELYPVY
jgi:hypothetical protein